jgi:hypothetical protein
MTYRDLAKMAKDCGKVPDAKNWPTNISYGASVTEYGQGRQHKIIAVGVKAANR